MLIHKSCAGHRRAAHVTATTVRPATATAGAPELDDRVLRATRVVSAGIVLILVAAVSILWGAPDRTAELWAWTITPAMTPVFMGSAYGAGAYFFLRVVRARRWHAASAGMLSAAVFAAIMLVVTAVHFDRFNHGDAPPLAAIAYYGWVVVYIVSPALVGGLWLINRRRDPHQRGAEDPTVPPLVRWLARLVAASALIAAVVYLTDPAIAIAIWPWHLTPLTARVLAAFIAQVGVGAALLSLDDRWSAWRITVETYLVATVLLLTGAARARSSFDAANPLSWSFITGLLALAVGLASLLWVMRGRTAARARPAAQ